METERRRRTRVPIHFDIAVSLRDELIKIETRNVSLTGMLCEADERLATGSPCEVVITLNPEVVITIQASILRTDGDMTAISFVSMSEESFFHLKKLLQYNLDDADRIEEELLNPAFKG